MGPLLIQLAAPAANKGIAMSYVAWSIVLLYMLTIGIGTIAALGSVFSKRVRLAIFGPDVPMTSEDFRNRKKR